MEQDLQLQPAISNLATCNHLGLEYQVLVLKQSLTLHVLHPARMLPFLIKRQ